MAKDNSLCQISMEKQETFWGLKLVPQVSTINRSTTMNQQGKGNSFWIFMKEKFETVQLLCAERLELMIPWPRL